MLYWTVFASSLYPQSILCLLPHFSIGKGFLANLERFPVNSFLITDLPTWGLRLLCPEELRLSWKYCGGLSRPQPAATQIPSPQGEQPEGEDDRIALNTPCWAFSRSRGRFLYKFASCAYNLPEDVWQRLERLHSA